MREYTANKARSHLDEATDIVYVHMHMVADIGNSSPTYIYLVVYWFVDYSLLYVLGSGCITTPTLLLRVAMQAPQI